ncbi:MAG TPA: GNAT family N-acetyltransferase [Pyrinomonadaceae bacterium]
MPQASDIEIRLLAESDIGEAMKIKELVGWNQTEADWQRLLKVGPKGCFAAFRNGSLVGTTTTTSFEDDLAWIGMVLVHPSHRRMGIATKLLRHALDYLSNNVRTVKLDATADGKRLYEGLGFRVESLVERWTGVAIPNGRTEDEVEVVHLDETITTELLDLDRQAFCANRSSLIKELIAHASAVPAIVRAKDGSVKGYSIARRGSQIGYVGPMVATKASEAAALLDRTLDQIAGERVYVDVNTRFEGWPRVLLDRGFTKQRELIRMRFGELSNPTSPWVFGIAGPEVG